LPPTVHQEGEMDRRELLKCPDPLRVVVAKISRRRV
jgi:hypothetical protein